MVQFNNLIAVDWSASNQPSPKKPTKDAIWLAEATATAPPTTHYFRTRHACHAYLEQRLIELRDERTLVGWDFSFGYPQGFADALGLTATPAWRAVWDYFSELIEDTADNKSNRFAVGAHLNRQIGAANGPFWGVPAGQASTHLHPKRNFTFPVGQLAERRYVETLHPRMQSAWQLAYTGSVGSQSLLGIPYVRRLRDHETLHDVSRIWPFESLGARAGATILHAEIYPSLLTLPKLDAIPDREQVEGYVQWLQQRQADGTLPALLSKPWGEDQSLHRRVTEEEGWVLGLSH